ncbi:MAG: hypothetical protein LBI62_02975 [Candidatus Accumulibacter sp.]|jgi:hypothetical protein|nr:hypothetical protein [Accumulibacter sp.]
MASITRHKNGYRAQVYVGGYRQSKVFRLKREAEIWASQREIELRNDNSDRSKTLTHAITRHRDEVAPGNDGFPWELMRLNAFPSIQYVAAEHPARRCHAIRPRSVAKAAKERLRKALVRLDFPLASM